MTKQQLEQIYMFALTQYGYVLELVAEMLRRYGSMLGVMAPGLAEQLAVAGGVGVTANGTPFYMFDVKLASGKNFRSLREFGRAFQSALDETSYANCLPRLVVQRVDPLPGGYARLTVTIEGW